MTRSSGALARALGSAGRVLSPERFGIGDLAPELAIEPATPQSMADALGEVARCGAAAVPWGGGVRQEMGWPPSRYDAAISVRGLSRTVAIEPGDLTATVEAGMTLSVLQQQLAVHGQFVALESPDPDRETVGGILATAASGILRYGYGAPRDQLIGVTVAMTDGQLIKAGGRVVKNVAGYDLCKLFTGSFGTLGVIVEATFRVRPLPQSVRTWLGAFPSSGAADSAIAALMDSDIQPTFLQALDPDAAQSLSGGLRSSGEEWVVALGADGSDTLSRWTAVEADRLTGPAHSAVLEGEEAAGIRRELTLWCAPRYDYCIRMSVSSSAAVPLMEEARQRLLARGAGLVCLAASAGSGVIYAHYSYSAETPGAGAVSQASASNSSGEMSPRGEEVLTWLQQKTADLEGSCVVLRCPSSVRRKARMWGPAAPTEPLMRRIRIRMDSGLTLNPGRLFDNELQLSGDPSSGV